MIKVKVNGAVPIEVSNKCFPAGEVNIKVDFILSGEVTIQASMQSPKDFMELAMTVDAVRRRQGFYNKVFLEMPYVPYARQDRVCNEGEAHGAKVFCDLINTLNFDRVTILDPHSDVVSALLNNVEIVTQVDLFNNDVRLRMMADKKVLVAPDVGASKKVEALAKNLGHNGYIQGFKHRDLRTGKLSGFGYSGDVNGQKCLIVDDIVDRGGTFIGLAKELRAGGAKSVSLFVTHGVFSGGMHYLLENGIDHIYTTDSLNNWTSDTEEFCPQFNVYNWRE